MATEARLAKIAVWQRDRCIGEGGTMRRSMALQLVLAFVLGLMVIAASPGPVPAATELEPADVILVRYDSRLRTESSGPGHLTWTVDLLSPAGQVVGSLTHDIVCSTTSPPPCLIFDSTDTFRFAKGEIVSRAHESIAPSPADPGQVLVGIRPAANSIVWGTGVFEGRTGRVRMSGLHDGRELPEYATFDDFWLIELDPR